MIPNNFIISLWSKHRRLLLFIVFLLLLSGPILSFTDIDDHIWNAVHNVTVDETTKEKSIWLPSYQADIIELELPHLTKNASGITYDYNSDSLWVIVNKPPSLHEFDLQFNLLRSIDLHKFKDTEAIAYAGNSVFVFTDERKQTVAIAKIDEQTRELDRNALRQITINLNGTGNKGLEGLAIDPATNTIYAVRERDPMKLIKIVGFMDNSNRIDIEDLAQVNINDMHLDDLSGLHFDTKTNHLLILSHESKLLVEVDLKGNKLSYMDLEKGFNNLDTSIPQAEGVTMDGAGNLYIVSEPNLLYRFKKATE